ncbi:hypothetical protein [Lyngbya confervoides]|uniref:CARDB domain-containing protein n=1 Tax=Lyngbya confervoides BDU141951 TaxID=1574623 RepID=A0ABD4T570_9CYAN|nr:hypothetical protein [Lyngbya confervoides]MCM1983705.1 hypothetical protein [Lyngbya confervoides BDU141951]
MVNKFILGSLAIVVSLSGTATNQVSAKPVINPDLNIEPVTRPNLQIKPVPLLRCIDPAAESIQFQVIRRDSQFRGRVRITGVIKNVGSLAYLSQPSQQGLLLYENNRLVKTSSFQNLAPGATAQISYERDWNSSSPAEGEFPPTYKLLITYDPDIRLDGNPNNDDCRSSNNQAVRSGQGINELLR